MHQPLISLHQLTSVSLNARHSLATTRKSLQQARQATCTHLNTLYPPTTHPRHPTPLQSSEEDTYCFRNERRVLVMAQRTSGPVAMVRELGVGWCMHGLQLSGRNCSTATDCDTHACNGKSAAVPPSLVPCAAPVVVHVQQP